MARSWFYSFTMPDGQATPTYLQDQSIHTTRRDMLDAVLDDHLPGDRTALTCVDLACHEGFFALHLAHTGFGKVLGIDIRPENIAGAKLIRAAQAAVNAEFVCRDVLGSDASHLGQFDVVLMLGLLYHLENPVGALRIARSLTRRICLIETVIGPNLTGTVDWGSRTHTKPISGAFCVVDEAADVREGNREANVSAISLVPSLDALLFVMQAVGFSHVAVASPPQDGHEQLASGQRALVLGLVD
ncbi:MAG: methyltransferase domain-containing protein [Candidatus Dormibacteraeota bacterium]|uniref:Methyltransferase domain-containing protein n=1 Tax=Candidatus Amunia macphersoniae TaxID=3127014 RepID=A0A934KKL5_9BACT|nr:methyltransferase domain-containing protein [Candidatus Dormibacteraeota bacterium]